jgi:hypothetical protein
MNIAVAISKALAMEGPLGWAEVAKIAAAGVSLLGTIRSATMSSSGGGVPSVGGGAASTSAAAPQAVPSQALEIMLPAGHYSHEEVMAIIEGINDRVQNGATLISTKVAA